MQTHIIKEGTRLKSGGFPLKWNYTGISLELL